MSTKEQVGIRKLAASINDKIEEAEELLKHEGTCPDYSAVIGTELNRALGPLLEIVTDAINAVGHKTSCNFKACSCGAVEGFKEKRLEYYRALERFNREDA